MRDPRRPPGHRVVSTLDALPRGLLALGLVLSGLAPSPVFAQLPADSLARSVARELARFEHREPGATVGIHVLDVETGVSRFAHDADRLLIAASNTKLATTAAALDLLGPGHFFETRLLARGPLAAGVLHGDLAVVGGGDPGISWRPYPYPEDPFAVFRRWAEALHEQGIERVEGDLVLAYGLFPRPWIHPEWKPENRLEWYQVPVAALDFHENVLQLRAVPAEIPGRPATVATIPSVPGFEPLREVGTTASWRQHGLRVDQLGGSGAGGSALRVSGGVYRGAHHVDAYVAVDDPVGYFGQALITALRQEGITVKGAIRPVETLHGLTWRSVAVHRTDLLTAIEVTNRESQNLYAESLIKLLGAKTCGRGTWDRGVEAVRGFLTTAGIEPGTYHLADGSGLARSNRLSARQFTRLLRFMHGHRWSAELLGSLPRGGQPGTSLEKRLTEPEVADRVAAKTGTLNGVSTLSGYVRGRSGRLYAFSALVNFPGQGGPVWRARKLQDAVVRAIIDAG